MCSKLIVNMFSTLRVQEVSADVYGLQSEASWREMMNPRISDKAPIFIALDSGQGNICRCWHGGHVRPQCDVRKRRSLDLVQGARVPKPHREMRDLLF